MMLRVNTRLKVLNLSDFGLDAGVAVSILQQVTTHPTLSSVTVSVLGVGNVSMERTTSSIRCDVNNTTPENCVEFFRALNHSGIKYLSLIVRSLTDQTAEHFAVGLAGSKSFQILDFSYNQIGSAGAMSTFRSLEHHTSLEELDLSGNSQLAVGDSEAVGWAIERLLRLCATLKVLNLNKCGLDTAVATHIAAGLEHNISLEQLDLSKNRLLAEGGSEAVGCAIERMLRLCATLKVLNLNKCGLDTAVAIHIVAGLEHNTSLEQLDLSENWQLAEGDSEAVGCAIERMLRVNTRLKVLNLSCCRLDTAVATHIAAGLEHNISLEQLNLSENWQLAEGDSEDVGCAIERVLKVNKILKVLNLIKCGLDTVVATHIATGLAQSSLAELNIAVNDSITNDGWVYIFKHLRNNSFLKKLDISNNCGLESSSALAEMLSCNKSLTELDIRYCGIPQAGLTELARGLLQNTSLQTLKIDEADYTTPTRRKTFLEAEIERLKRSGHFTSQMSIEIKAWPLYYVS